MRIQVLGPGCPSCEKLAENTRAAVKRLGLEADCEKVTDMAEILQYNVMQTPALIVNEEVCLVGTAGDVDGIVELLEQRREEPA